MTSQITPAMRVEFARQLQAELQFQAGYTARRQGADYNSDAPRQWIEGWLIADEKISDGRETELVTDPTLPSSPVCRQEAQITLADDDSIEIDGEWTVDESDPSGELKDAELLAAWRAKGGKHISRARAAQTPVRRQHAQWQGSIAAALTVITPVAGRRAYHTSRPIQRAIAVTLAWLNTMGAELARQEVAALTR